MTPVCRHCQDPARPVNRPRGLCWRCFYTPGVKEMYPSGSKYARRGVGNGTGGHSLPLPAPTSHEAGSSEKLAVLIARAEAGQALWHPLDAGLVPPAADPFAPLVLDLAEGEGADVRTEEGDTDE